MGKRERLDQKLVELGLAESREKAQRLILAGFVLVQGQKVTKPSKIVPEDAIIEVAARPRYVSRGGEKLEAALRAFQLDVRNKICLDIGASTGGFTDCLLQHGAAKVYALDVGRGQLHPSLARDPRVHVLDGINARYLKPSDLPELPSVVTVDVSFISLRKILPAVAPVLVPGGDLVTLIKPQFEAKRNEVKRGGVIRDPEVRLRVIQEVREFGEKVVGLTWVEGCDSPVPGPAGNIEYLAHWRKEP